jgi:membrane associated rhomboid family serine protease
LYFPVTSATGIFAIAVTAMWWTGWPVEAVEMNGRVWEKWELWRALTCVLPHGGIFHLAFNLYWLWTFGTLVERELGHLKCLGIFIVLALVSSFFEFALLNGGVGLSGVGYGLWGMLWVLEKRDARFAGAVDFQTTKLFVGWFFFCILLTVANVMPIGNIAHATGAGAGALLGLAMSAKMPVRRTAVAGLVLALAVGIVGSTVLWPWVNLSDYCEPTVERAGTDALERGENQRALKFLEISAHMRHAPARAWYNLAIARQRAGKLDDALAAYEHAAQMPDADEDIRKAAREMKEYDSSYGNSH